MRLIRGGDGARALVVGIDRYDFDQISPLTGAVADALAACRWLLDIGVDPAAIDLHLSPAAPLAAAALAHNGHQLLPDDAKWTSVWRSLHGLKSTAGERLFIFLSGHGLAVPPAEPIFLLQDYGTDGDWSCNLGLTSFADYFLSLDFAEQFLFCDACENFATAPSLRSSVSPRLPPNHGSLVVGGGGLLAVHSASPGQRAFEHEGRGLMMSGLLARLDPARLAALPSLDPAYAAISLDWDKGEWGLDVPKLITELVGPEVSRKALAAKGASQDPRTLSAGRRVGEILRWTRDDLGKIVVEVDPASDAAEVDVVRLVTLEPTWSLNIFNPGEELPRTLTLPVGIDLIASARGRLADRPVDPPRSEATVTAEPGRVTFSLLDPTRGARSARPADLGFNVRIFGENGAERYDAGPIYSEPFAQDLMRDVRSRGFHFDRHEYGPDISLPGLGPPGVSWGSGDVEGEPWSWDEPTFTEGLRLSNAWAGLLKERLGGFVLVTPPGVDPGTDKPNLILHLPTKNRLVGYLASSAPLVVRRLSDDEIVEEIELSEGFRVHIFTLPPDLYELGLDLPWGRWRQRVLLRSGQPVHVKLPGSVGRPPLRNLSNAYARRAREPAKGEIGQLTQVSTLTVACCPGITLALDREETRVEPVSKTPHPGWDAVFAVQRLDLAYGSFEDYPLGLLTADDDRPAELELLHLLHAYTQRLVGGRGPGVTLERLRKLTGSLDALLLMQEEGKYGPDARETIAGRWRDGQRPLLRWGYDLILVLDLLDPRIVVAEASRQLPGSAWTALRKVSSVASEG